MRTIGFSLIGGSHQFLHGLPVAAALSRRSGVVVEVFVVSDADADRAREMLNAFGAGAVEVIVLRLPRLVERAARREGAAAPLKTLRLAWWSRRLRPCTTIVALERTSAFLARLPGHCPPLIQIPHGVGGARRAGGNGVDGRFSAFDLALVAGEADRRSTIDAGLLPAERVQVVGQIKLSGLNRLGLLQRKRLFANARPTILYNPHFHPRRGSWEQFGRALIDALGQDRAFNLIVAPHVRLFADASASEREALEALGDPNWLIIDTGSSRSMDMTYTLGADIYLGDFSSQLYEWLIFPRPCVFIDQVGDGGAGDTKLPEMWSMGETVTSFADLLPALSRARVSHPDYRHRQSALMHDAVGDFREPADEVAADAIVAFLEARQL